MKKVIVASMIVAFTALCAAVALQVSASEDSWRPFEEPAYSKHVDQGTVVVLGFVKSDCTLCNSKKGKMSPILADSRYSNVVPYKVDMDQQPALVQKLNVTSHPTVIVFKNKKEVGRLTGDITEAQFRALLDKAE